MREYSEFFNLVSKNDSATRTKILTYFKNYNFKIATEENQKIIFKNKSTWLNSYKMNFLSLPSKITVHFLEQHKVQIHYQVINAGFGALTPMAFTKQYQDFIRNLDNYIHKNESFQQKNATLIKAAKIKLLKNTSLLLIALALGFVLASILKKQLVNSWVTSLVIMGTVLISEKALNAYHVSKNKVQ